MTEASGSEIGVGDLVCMYRRRSKGLGIVVKHCRDIGECLGADPETILKTYREYAVKDWRVREQFKLHVCSESCDYDLVFDFFLYNTAYRDKLKVGFVFVEWVKKPSDHSSDAVYSKSGWFPVEWLKTY